MAQVPSDPLDIKRAFRRHQDACQIEAVARRPKLVSLFYAAECGLKYIIMSAQSLNSTDDLRSCLMANFGLPRNQIDLHNIEQLCGVANFLPVDVGVAPAQFQVNGTSFHPYKMHEAARYGVKIPDAYVVSVEQWLKAVVVAVEARMAAMGT